MFGILGNSLKLLAISWKLLTSDRELLVFPLMMGGALFFVFAYTAVAFWAGGTFDRVGLDYSFYPADFIFLVLAYFLASFAIVYFGAALSATVHQRLEGFYPDMQTGLMAANDQLGAVAGWSVLAASVALVMNELSNSRSLLGRIFGFAVRMFWGHVTFFVVPVLVIESANPLEALSRSTEIFRQQWTRTMVANFGFGFAYAVVALPAMGLGALLYFGLGSVFLAVTIGAALLMLGIATVKSLETVYTVALYNYAVSGRVGGGFTDTMLQEAWVSRQNRGRFRTPMPPRPSGTWRAA